MALIEHDDPNGPVGSTRGGVHDHQTTPLVRPYEGCGPYIEQNYDCHTDADGVGSTTTPHGVGPEG